MNYLIPCFKCFSFLFPFDYVVVIVLGTYFRSIGGFAVHGTDNETGSGQPAAVELEREGTQFNFVSFSAYF